MGLFIDGFQFFCCCSQLGRLSLVTFGAKYIFSAHFSSLLNELQSPKYFRMETRFWWKYFLNLELRTRPEITITSVISHECEMNIYLWAATILCWNCFTFPWHLRERIEDKRHRMPLALISDQTICCFLRYNLRTTETVSTFASHQNQP